MATLHPAWRRINQELARFLPPEQIEQACRSQGYHFRRRKLTPVLTVHLLVLQLLAQGALRQLRRITRLPQLSRQAIAQARDRLPLGVLLRLVEDFCQACGGFCPTAGAGPLGLRLVLVDGFASFLEDTPALRQRYGKARNQHGESPGRPVPKLLALLDYSTGLLHRVIALPQARQEISCLKQMFRHLHPGDLLLGDRGLVSFAHLALLRQRGVQGCLRLSSDKVVHGRGNTHHRKLKRLGKQDLLVRWLRVRRPRWMSQRRFARLPVALELRQIAFRLVRPGYRTQWAWIITSLTDPQRYPAPELIRLYQQRWQVEVYFRDLKVSLGMGQLQGQNPQRVRKQILGFVLLYNLVRMVVQQAAQRQQVAAQRISFRDALDWLLWALPGETLPVLEVNPLRQRPTQPRRRKRSRPKYPPLTQPREALVRPSSVAIL